MFIHFDITILAIITTAIPAFCGENFIVNSLEDIAPLEPLESLVFDEVNAIRGADGLGELIRDTQLDDAARHHSKEMAEEGYFGHESPRPELADHSLRIYNAGLADCTVGENLRMYWTTEPLSNEELSGKIVQGWLDSEPHKKTMLKKNYDYSGIGFYSTDEGAIYCTQLFSDRTLIFDEIVLSSDVEYIRRVSATFSSDEDIIYLRDGDYAGRFSADDGIAFVDFFLKYDGGPAVVTLGREVAVNKIKAFYEKEVDPTAGFYLEHDITDGSLIKEEVSVEEIGKYNVSAAGRLINPGGEMFIVDGESSTLLEYGEDGTFSVDYPIYDNTGIRTVYFVINNSSNHRIIINSEKPVEEAFMKMQVLPDK